MQAMMKLGEAAAYLGVSTVKMWKLVNEGVVRVYSNPLDGRQKLFRVEDLDKLKKPSPVRRRKAS